MTTDLTRLKDDLQQEFRNILQYWMQHAVDQQYGGFYGKINNNNVPDPNAPKGLVLNARILWTFSAAYNLVKERNYLLIADRAFQYIVDHFTDIEHGGFFWSIDKDGHTTDAKKQVYGLAFCLYGFSEYYKATGKEEAFEQAKNCYSIIEQYSFDPVKGGYLEAFSRDWQPVDDLRLSVKDANEKKTMNTHLHVLEAYTSLYKIWPVEQLRNSLVLLIDNFIEHIIDHKTGHLNLFFAEDWKIRGHIISYGHDIEASWLLLEAAEITGNKPLIEEVKTLSLKMVAAAAKGLDDDGGLWYEKEHDQLVRQKHSWPQAEAMVGFFNAWQLSGNKKYLQYVFNNWQFIQQYILDTKNGEWYWGVNDDHTIMEGQDKAGFWKCPYHNTRACIELIQRIQQESS